LKVLFALALLLAGCGMNPRVNAPVLTPPQSRQAAARALEDALILAGRGVSEVRVDQAALAWNERHRRADDSTVMYRRELDLRLVRQVSRPRKVEMGWQLELEAAGGRLFFAFKDDLSASRAEAAFIRLMEPD